MSGDALCSPLRNARKDYNILFSVTCEKEGRKGKRIKRITCNTGRLKYGNYGRKVNEQAVRGREKARLLLHIYKKTNGKAYQKKGAPPPFRFFYMNDPALGKRNFL